MCNSTELLSSFQSRKPCSCPHKGWSSSVDATCWQDWELRLPKLKWNYTQLEMWFNKLDLKKKKEILKSRYLHIFNEKQELKLASDLWFRTSSGSLCNALFKALCLSCALMIAPEVNRPDTVVSLRCFSIWLMLVSAYNGSFKSRTSFWICEKIAPWSSNEIDACVTDLLHQHTQTPKLNADVAPFCHLWQACVCCVEMQND